MKILKLRFENLNSLNGKWEIDFTHPEYVSNGIFAITGPTGAGKSTILDAICLSLYGRTPRLTKVSASTNEIMSRQTGECYAELEFQTKKGQYRINWSQKRARGKSDGALQGSKHILYDINGTALEEKKRELADKIAELTGMDFDRFTRSILLAQGGFAAFLQATPDERAPILEEITGSEIYTEISMFVHETNREKQQVLELLKAGIDGIELLSEEDEKNLQSGVQANEKIEAGLKKKDKSTTDKITWIKSVDKLRNELSSLDEESKQVKAELNTFKPKRDILDKAQKALKIDSEYTLLKAKKENLTQDRKALDTDTKLLPELSEQLKQSEKLHKDKETESIQIKKAYTQELELLKKVRALDIKINEKEKLQKGINDKKEKLSEELKIGQTKVVGLETSAKKIETSKNDADAYIKNNPKDDQLNSSLAGIKERLNNLNISQQQVKDLQIKINNFEAEIKTETEKHEKEEINKKEAETSYKKILLEMESKKEELKKLLDGRFLREFRSEKDAKLKERIYIGKIASLEEERRQLEDDKPCPLCGSTHHPFALGNVPEISKIELEIVKLDKIITSAEKIESEITISEKSANSAKSEIEQKESNLKLLSQTCNNLNKTFKEFQGDEKTISSKFAETSKAVIAEIIEFGYNENSLDDTELLANKLSGRLQQWNKNKRLQDELVNNLNRIKADILRESALLKQLEGNLKSHNEESAAALKISSDLQTERTDIYGNKQPDLEEEKCAEAVVNVEKSANSAKSTVDQLKLKLKGLQTKINKLTEDIKSAEPVIIKLEKEFGENCLKLGFENEQAFSAARMDHNELEKLAEFANNLDKKSANVATRQGDVKKKLKTEDAKKLTEEPLDELIKQQSALERELGELREGIGGIRQKLKNNNESREKIKNSEREIKNAEKEASKWRTLHALIGSVDGKKFRNFAQGLTFQIMVSYANKQLTTMTDRYLLVRDKDSPLELNVIDNYQAGEERSTKNLSGGESFIVSLALALGLSNMASRNVSVDSLFLDEGFGTLDEDSLEMALESLSTLQQENKLIGIISHVGALKERITTQINVNPITGGKSKISGPGCSVMQ